MPDTGGAGGAGGGTGAGYNIPISLSYARSEASNPVFGAPTYFNFSSPFSSFGGQESNSSQTPVATATSSAAEHDANAQSSTPVITSGPSSGSSGLAKSLNWQWIILGGLAAVAVVASVYLIKRK